MDNDSVGTQNKTLPAGYGGGGGGYVNLFKLLKDIIDGRGVVEGDVQVAQFTARIINYGRSGIFKLQIDVASNPSQVN